MKKVNESEVPFKYGSNGPKYLYNEEKFSGGVAHITPGEELKEHSHADEREIFYFFKGSPLFMVNGTDIRIRQGDAFTVDVNEKHAIKNDTKETISVHFVKIKI